MNLADFEYFEFKSNCYGGDQVQVEKIGASIASMATRAFVASKYEYIFDDLINRRDRILNAKTDEEKIVIIATAYLIKYTDLSSTINLDEDSVLSIKKLGHRILDFIKDKNIDVIDKYRLLVNDSLIYILVSVKEPNFKKITEDARDHFDAEKYNNIVNNFVIFNPRLNKSYTCNLQENVGYNSKKIKERQEYVNFNIQAEIEYHEKITKIINDDGRMTDYEYELMCNEAKEINPNLDNKTIFREVNRLKKVLGCSFRDAFDQYLEDLTYGITHKPNEIMYEGIIYKNRQDLIKKVFHTKTNISKINSSINQRRRYHDITLEEAIDMTLKDKENSKCVIYKHKKYKNKKVLIESIFPDRPYSSVAASICAYEKKHNCTFIEAIDGIKEFEASPNRGFSKEITYNGVTYKSLRAACRAYSLKPEKLSKIAKNLNNNYVEAIDWMLSHPNK